MEMIQIPRIIEPIESRIIIETFIPFQYPDGTKITKTLISGNIYEIKYTKNKYSEKTFTGIYIDIDYHIMEKEYEYDKSQCVTSMINPEERYLILENIETHKLVRINVYHIIDITEVKYD